MKLDEVLEKVGDFGWYQKRLYILLNIPAMTCGAFMMLIIIQLYTPAHRCRIHGLDNDTYAIQGEWHQELINQTIPSSTDGISLYDKCHVFGGNKSGLVKCEDWVYDQSVFYSTLTSKIHMVCDEALKTSHAQMLFYFGVLVGDFVYGVIADVWGRKKSLYIGFVVILGSSIGAIWSSSFESYSILQFLAGGSSHAGFVISIVLMVEFVGPSKRVIPGTGFQFAFAAGIIYLSGVSYFLRDWVYIQVAMAVPCAFYISYWWLMPESPRWFLSKKRVEEAEALMRRVAKVNKTELPTENIFDEEETAGPKNENVSVLRMFTSKILLPRVLIMFFNWFVVCMIYYGVVMNVENLGGNYYLNFFLMACAEFPGYTICFVLVDRIGRRLSQCLCMVVGGLACICTLFVILYGDESLSPLLIVLSLIGKIGASSGFALVYIYTAELLPTVVRNAGMGASSCFARIGIMVAPYIAKSGELIGGKYGKAHPLVIFGVMGVVAGLLCLLLPETMNKKLPETMEDSERFGIAQDLQYQEFGNKGLQDLVKKSKFSYHFFCNFLIEEHHIPEDAAQLCWRNVVWVAVICLTLGHMIWRFLICSVLHTFKILYLSPTRTRNVQIKKIKMKETIEINVQVDESQKKLLTKV